MNAAPPAAGEPAREIKIVVIEDDPDLGLSLKYNLEKEARYRVEVFKTGERGLDALRRKGADLVILDLNLPGMDGLETCREIRRDRQTEALPILVLTARTGERDKVLGLDLGADDYMTKPFSLREVSARVNALLRRTARAAPRVQSYRQGPLRIDFDKRRVDVEGREVTLTRKEFQLLSLLVKSAGRTLERDEIIRRGFGEDSVGSDRNVDVHVRNLRVKLGAAADLLETVRGAGYRFRDPGGDAD